FAITTHRQKRISRLSRSSLEDVPGVGKHTAAVLLSTFGSVQRVAALSPEELQKAPGIGPKQAARIAAFLAGLHDEDGAEQTERKTQKSAAAIVAASHGEKVLTEKKPRTKYNWNETIDVPYEEQLPKWRETPDNERETQEERPEKPDLAQLLGVRHVRRTYDPKRKRGIHRA
ncbi:MAG: excinuclease ABC subunit UvrC, partial [Pyramidobacter sp.]|nr:excinuclease ABC subunit UvrC [Pyramidobacter sp.]